MRPELPGSHFVRASQERALEMGALPVRQVKTVRIGGVSKNIIDVPPPPEGVETWLFNNPRGYRIQNSRVMTEWTRWFNMHTKRHQLLTYPRGYEWYKQQTKPIYLQKADPEIPASIEFPRAVLQEHFRISDKTFRYFTFSGAWLIALAIYEGFERIEMWGHNMKANGEHAFQRPGYFYWIKRARDMGVDLWVPPGATGGVGGDTTPAGDPETYKGPLYGYEPHSNLYRHTF